MASMDGLLEAWAAIGAFHRLTIYTEAYFKLITICSAALWLSYRIYRVMLKPTDELISLLGLEVPTAPSISLAGVKADGITLHLKPPDHPIAFTKYQLHINGINVGEIFHKETTMSISNLKPEHSYTTRIVAANPHFQTASNPVRFATKPASSESFYKAPVLEDHGDDDGYDDFAPTIRACKPLFESNLQPSVASPMAREHSNSISHKQRSPQPRRISPIIGVADGSVAPLSVEAEGNVKELTDKLESLRQEVEEAENQDKMESEDFERTRNALVDERTRQREQLNEKETATRELKKEVARLEKRNTNANQVKSSAEKKLREKQTERKKMKDDMLRWDAEIIKMQQNVQNLIKQKRHIEATCEKKLDDLRDELSQMHTSNKVVEDFNKDKSRQIKILEQNKSRSSTGDAEVSPPATEAIVDDEIRLWEEKLRHLQGRYTYAWSAATQAEQVYQAQKQHLSLLQQRRTSSPQLFASTPTLDPVPIRRECNRRRRTASLRSDIITSPSSTGFAPIVGPLFHNSSMSSISPTFSTNSPFFNFGNGTSLMSGNAADEGLVQRLNLSRDDYEKMTGYAPMSPTAGAMLLPAGLLADDAEQDGSDVSECRKEMFLRRCTHGGRPLSLGGETSSLSASNRNSIALPGLGAIPGLGAASNFDSFGPSPSPPVSVDSRSPSVFASPKQSTTNLSYTNNEAFDAADRRSIRSNTGSSRGASGTSRFANILGLGQRGKSTTDNGPLLGSLRSAQSQSLPREEPPELEPIGSRRRGSHSGPSAWMQPFQNAFTRTASSLGKDSMVGEEETEVTSSASRRLGLHRLSLLGRSGNQMSGPSVFDPSTSMPSRPPSTPSTELPRPSTGREGGNFGWPAEGVDQRMSPLGSGWDATAPNSFSRHPSRRTSVQYGQPMLGQDPSQLDSTLLDTRRSISIQAPIGTRPTTSNHHSSESQSPVPPISTPPTPPRLNPAAPAFNIFKRNKKTEDGDKDKAEKDKGQAKEKAKDIHLSQTDTAAGDSTSLSESRKSKDARSISTANNSLELTRPRESLEGTCSGTPSENVGAGQLMPNSVGVGMSSKETFMQKLSRKTSAGKFKAPFGKDNKGLFASAKRGPTSVGGLSLDGGSTPDELDEDREGLLGTSVESMHGSTSGGSPVVRTSSWTGREGRTGLGRWGSFKLSNKRRDRGDRDTTPSINNDSMASETGDEEEDVPEMTIVAGA